ncbi:MAG: sugar ABC transporter permease [Clostridia bacterium]|nr:sugar ABC transporter permease [Clostridia bacterium]
MAMRKGIRQWGQALPFIAPALILLCMFVLYPLARNIQISFSDYDILANRITASVGLSHYQALFQSKRYLLALRNTLLYALVTVPGQMFLGLVLACLINNVRRGQTVCKVISYLPVLTSWVIVSLIFRYLFMSGKGGLINYALMQTGLLSSPVSWLQSEWTANLVLWLFGIWKGVGWVMVIDLAALQGVPRDLYEAAQIESANAVQIFFRITIPMVRNTTLYLLTVLTIGAFGAYIHVMMITEGAPLGTTNELMNFMYDTAFSKYEFGSAAAQSVLMGLMIFLLTLVQRRVTTEMVN